MATSDEDAAPRWLDPAERQAWLGLLTLMTRLSAQMNAQMLRSTDLSTIEYYVLALLSEAPDRTLQMSAIASVAALSLSRLSHTTRRLEARGWVRRAPLPSDGRLTVATLTESGYAKVVASAPDHVRLVRSLVLDVLDEQQIAQLTAITGQLNDQLAFPAGPDSPCGPPDAAGPGR